MKPLRNPSRVFPLLLAVLLAGLTLWLQQLIAWLPIGTQKPNLSTIDYQLDGFIGTEFDLSGQVKQRLGGVSMWQYPESKVLYLKKPHFWNYQAGKLKAEIIGNNATYNTDTKIGYFSDAVRLIRPPQDANSLPAILDTTQLTVNVDQKTMHSPAAAHFAQGATLTDSVGFTYNDTTQYLRLLSQVRTTYVPQHRAP